MEKKILTLKDFERSELMKKGYGEGFPAWIVAEFDKDHEVVFEEDVINYIAYWIEPVATVSEERHRWVESITEVYSFNGRNFLVSWEKGLTENQDDLFERQALYEVSPTKKYIEVTVWEPIDSNS